MNAPWPVWRTRILLAAVLVTSVFAAQAALTRKPLERPLPPFAFPSHADFGAWRSLSFPALDPSPDDPLTAHTIRYRFQRGEDLLGLEMRAIPDLSVHYLRNPKLEMRFLPHGYLPLDAGMNFLVDSSCTVRTNAAGNSSPLGLLEIRHHPEVGAFGFWEESGRCHLSAVLTPEGRCHATRQDTARATYLGQLSLRRLGQWLLAREPLPDTRCATLHLALRIEGRTSDETRSSLEEALLQWLPRCRDGFAPGKSAKE